MNVPARSFAEDELVPLSALQHLVFCERQCALIHIEQVWRDNPLTLEGSNRHDRTHETAPRREMRGDMLITRGLQVRSFRLGVSGVADVVEFHRVPATEAGRVDGTALGAALPGVSGLWEPFPVEFKRGRPKPDHCDEVQVCAQAICLEEMLGVLVTQGALFYGATQHRHDVRFGPELRQETAAAAIRLHALLDRRISPRVRRERKCDRCSLVDICRPDATAPGRSARRYLRAAVRGVLGEEVSET